MSSARRSATRGGALCLVILGSLVLCGTALAGLGIQASGAVGAGSRSVRTAPSSPVEFDTPRTGSSGRAAGPVFVGPELDYQPSVILRERGDLMLVFERLVSMSGDLYLTISSDQGVNWTTPQAIISTQENERHPELIQVSRNSYLLFYLINEPGAAGFRIHRATSSDGMIWSDQGAADLGWAVDGDINPSVILESDGSLTMTYQRADTGRAHIARSTDLGLTWDKLRTAVTTGDGRLPRIVKREHDGLYLVSYQVDPGNHDIDVFAKVSRDPYDWSTPAAGISTVVNSHDSQAVVLPGGAFAVFYASTPEWRFDVFYSTSCDGVTWSSPVQVTSDPERYDTQPHPIRGWDPDQVILAWSHQESSAPYGDHDVWIDPSLVVDADPCVQVVPASSKLMLGALLVGTGLLAARGRHLGRI